MIWQRCILLLLAVALAGGLALTAQAGNTTKRTGKGATRDDSVYCQNWPGHSSRPPYPGTGPQTPCGPNFEKPSQPPPPPPQSDATACPARQAALEGPLQADAARPGFLLAAASAAQRTHGLWVGGQKITNAGQVGLASASAIRQEILQAMICSPHRVFDFANNNELQWTIELRVKIMALMRALSSGGSQCQFMAGGGVAFTSKWQGYPEPSGSLRGDLRDYPSLGQVAFAARARAEVRSAHAAVQAFRTERSSLDCMAGMEITILEAADSVLGEINFDRFHRPVVWPHFAELSQLDRADAGKSYVLIGLGVPPITIDTRTSPYKVTDNRDKTSLSKHLVIVRYHVAGGDRGETRLDRDDDPMAGPITTADMVPGDYAYLNNLPDYEDRPAPGPWAGENAFYLGEDGQGAALFYGYGFYDAAHPELNGFLTEAQLRDGMARGYNEVSPAQPATAAEMQWTRLGAPTLYGDPRTAGMFERPAAAGSPTSQ